MSSTLAVLEDAILWQGGALPDELCPLYLVDAGRRLGGDAAAVAEAALREHREAWFGSYDPTAIWAHLCKSRGKGKLTWLEVQRAVWFHVESERQIVAAWGADALVVLSDADFVRQAANGQRTPRGQTGHGHLRTLAKPEHPLRGVFRIQSRPMGCAWVGDRQEAKTRGWSLRSSVSSPLGFPGDTPQGWRWGEFGRHVRIPVPEEMSRRVRDATRARIAARHSRAEEAGLSLRVGGGR